MTERLVSKNFAEKLRPDVTPELGFQSYELLAGDGAYRKKQRDEFISGTRRNPELDYPALANADEQLQPGIHRLEALQTEALELDEEIARDAVYDSIAYRLAEMYWIKEAARMNELAGDADSDVFRASAERYQTVNEELYGTPEAQVTAAVYGEILAQAHAKELHPSVQKIYDELRDGTTMTVGNEEVRIPGIAGKEEGRLPQNMSERLAVLREVIHEEFGDLKQAVDSFWYGVTVNGSKTGLEPSDMKELFEYVHQLRDPENTSGIITVIDENSASLAWDTPSMSLKIGGRRAKITSANDMFAKVVHEYGKHGGSAHHGLATELPVLGTGVYSEASPGERPDYLTFEEGFSSLSEMALDDSFSGWKPLHVSRYMALASLYEGADFRQAYEANWRARVVMAAKDNQPADDKLVLREKRQAWMSVVRVLRGTPTDMENRPLMTFNKDLAYLHGKLDALRYLEKVGDDKEKIRAQFTVKIDPNNTTQANLARHYGIDV